MQRATLLFPIAILGVTSAFAESTHMTVFFGGAPAGESTYDVQPDGTFTATTKIKIGGLTLESSMAGKYENGRLISYTSEQSGQGPKSFFRFDHGKVFVKIGGKETEAPGTVTNEPYFGNLNPSFTASALAKVDFSKKSTQTLNCYSPDSSGIAPIKFTPEEERTTPKGVARIYKINYSILEFKIAADQAGHVVMQDVPAQKLRWVADGWESVVKDPLAAYPELSQPTYGFKIDRGVKMKTRDGVTLVQDVVRPDAPGKFPVILERTPYGRESAATEGPFYARRGYAFVVQDCRGRNESDGEWDPFMKERKDGYDAIQWAAKQPWSDGNVGMIGGSYGGLVQWAAAVEQPPALKCIVPQVSPPDAMLNIPYDNGVFFLYGAVWWSKIVAGKQADMSSILSKLPHPENFGTLPLSKVDEAVLGKHLQFYAKWLKRTTEKDWTGYNYEADVKNVKIPVLHISGWWDGDEIGTMTNWQLVRAHGKARQWLVYGPWTHSFNTTSKIGDTDFGPDAVIDLDSVYLRWFDTWLKHKSVSFEKQPKVRAFVTGSNKWVESTDWPLVNSKKTTLYLAATGAVEGMSSTGTLEPKAPATQAPSKYKFDPHDAKIDARVLDPDPNKASLKVEIPKVAPGLCIFKSAPMTEPTTVSGPIVLDLRFSTSAQDTDFFANLLDVDENGNAMGIGQSGKIRCSYIQKGLAKQTALVPGKIYKAEFRLWDTAHQFAKGHRICLMLSSTAFPLFARNLGTIDPIATATRIVVQNQKIYHDAKNPSSITFQVSH